MSKLFNMSKWVGETIIKNRVRRAEKEMVGPAGKLISRKMYTHKPNINWRDLTYGPEDVRRLVAKERFKSHSVVVHPSTGETIGPVPGSGMFTEHQRRTRKLSPVGGRTYESVARGYVKPPSVRPTTVASKAQLSRRVEQLLSPYRMSKKQTMGAYQGEPSNWTRLYEATPYGEKGAPVDMPFQTGLWKMRQSSMGMGPEMIPERGHIPPADVMTPEGQLQRRVYKPVEESYQRAITGERAIEADRAAQELEQARLQRRRDMTVEGSVVRSKVESTPAEELFQMAHKLDQVWKQIIGGRRTLLGRRWDILRESSRGRNKPKDARDYFIRVGLKWADDPEATAKVYPREVKLLEELFKE